jgi:hypothetical protein
VKKAKPARKRNATTAPALFPISEEMKQWSAMLAAEVGGWPRVHSKPMFGLMSFYRRGKIFAAIPRTRAVASPHAIIMKFHKESAETREARRQLADYPALRWLAFDLHSEKDLNAALRWLDLAYRMAR